MTSLQWDWRLSKWLPPDVALAVESTETANFARLVEAFEEFTTKLEVQSVNVDLKAFNRLIPWHTHITKALRVKRHARTETYPRMMFLKTRMMYQLEDVTKLYYAVMRVVLASNGFVGAHLMWISTAMKILKLYRNALQHTIVLDWHIYWDLLHKCIDNCAGHWFDASGRISALSACTELAKEARALFAPAAAIEIWARLRPDLVQGLSPASLEAVSLLLVFFPHRGIARDTSLAWGNWAAAAVDMWASVVHNAFWDGAWLCFLARLAKYDIPGVINWHPILRGAMTRAAWVFNIPVGGSAGVHRAATPPRFPLSEVCHNCVRSGSSSACLLAKLLVYTLRADVSARAEGGGLSPLHALEQLSALLEHYFHASNLGSWSVDLGSFLDSLSWYLCRRRLANECRPEWQGSAAVKLPLSPELAPFVEAMLRLAEPAVFHKAGQVRSAALEVLGNVAYVAPERVLPSVMSRLFEALEATESVHQLGTAIRALSGCVRPILLLGLSPPPPLDSEEGAVAGLDTGGLTPHERACHQLGQAMVLVLPGLDANDQNKTEATVSLYLAVFSSCTSFAGTLDTLPGDGVAAGPTVAFAFDSEDFVLELLRRLAEVIDNLRTQGSAADSVDATKEDAHYCPSWLGSYHKFDPMVSELFRKMPEYVLPSAVDFVARFALDVSDPQQASDAFSIVCAAVNAAPNQLHDRLWGPLMDTALDDADSLAGIANPSQAATKRLHARLLLLLALLRGLPARSAACMDRLVALTLQAASARSPAVIAAAGGMLSGALAALTVRQIDTGRRASGGDSENAGVPGILGGAVAMWASLSAEGTLPVAWRVSEPAHSALARSTCERLVEIARGEVAAMKAEGSIADASNAARLRLRKVQTLLGVAMSTHELGSVRLRTAASDVALPKPEESLEVVAPVDTVWAGCDVIDIGIELSLDIAASTDTANTAALIKVVRELKRFAGVTMTMRSQGHPGSRIKHRDRAYNEPAIAAVILGYAPPSPSIAPTTRQAYWATERAVSHVLALRMELVATSLWPSTFMPQLPLSAVCPLFRRAVAACTQLSMSRYTSVASRAARGVADLSHVSQELAYALLPSIVASAALLPSPLLLPEALKPDRDSGGFALPETVQAASDALARQVDELKTSVSRGGIVVELADLTVVSGENKPTTETGAAGKVSNENKHYVLGGLKLLETMRSSVTQLCATDPMAFAAFMMSAFVMQQYALPEVIPSVNKFLASFGLRLLAPAFCAAKPAPEHLTRLVSLLIGKLASSQVHWRFALLAHVLFAVLVGSTEDPQLLGPVVDRQLQDCNTGSNLLVQEVAASALLQTLHSCLFIPDSSSWRTSTVLSCVCNSANADYVTLLLRTLDSQHAGEASKASVASLAKSSPEALLVMMLRQAPERVKGRFRDLVLCREPRMPAPAEGGHKSGRNVAWHHAHLLDALACAAPMQMAEGIRGPLKDWDALSPEEEAGEPSMEFTAMAAVYGALASSAAFQCGSLGGSSAWGDWLKAVIESRLAAAATDLSKIWGYVLARSLGTLALRVSGMEKVASKATPAAAFEHGLEELAAFVCSQADKWSGKTTSDTRYAQMFMFCIDLLMQVQAICPCKAVGAALGAVLARSHAILPSALGHPLQAVRTSGSQLAALSLGVSLSSQPLLEPALGARSAEDMLVTVRNVFQDATGALTAANAPSPPADLSTPGNSTEARIGSAAALAQALASTPALQPLVLEVLTDAVVPWVVNAQGLHSPALQGLMMQLRSLMVSMKTIVLSPSHMPVLLRSLRLGTTREAWQARAAALSILQVAWFRNFFSLGPNELLDVVETCRERLLDTRPEIGTLAGGTLSGLIRILPASQMDALLRSVLSDAQRLFPQRRRGKGTTGVGAEPPQAQRHACALSLRALLQSSPYEMQPWMDEALLAIVRAARFPPPVGTTATQALGDFRKTHESTASLPLRQRLSPEVWEGIMDVALQSSYFA